MVGGPSGQRRQGNGVRCHQARIQGTAAAVAGRRTVRDQRIRRHGGCPGDGSGGRCLGRGHRTDPRLRKGRRRDEEDEEKRNRY